MFEDLIREIKSLEGGMKVSVSLPSDEKGFLDRLCPAKDCQASFKVSSEDWDAKVSDARVFCPLCRHEAKSDEWATAEQVKYAKAVAMRKFQARFHGALEAGARSFNRRQRPGFITLSLSMRPGSLPLVLPCKVRDIMEQEFTCEICACRYSSIGAAFFCPACGHNSASTMLDQTLLAVEKTIAAIPTIRQVFANDHDSAQDAIRLVTEQSLGKLVSAFERFNEAVFQMVPTAPVGKVKRGSFQRLNEASCLWREATGKGYEDHLNATEFAQLLLLFQKRHVLAHADGIVDADYLKRSGDPAYVIGQRIVVRETHVLTLLRILRQLGEKLRQFLPARAPRVNVQ